MRTKTLVFTEEEGNYFELLFEGFISGSGFSDVKKNLTVIKQEVRILDKIEAISIETDKKLADGTIKRSLLLGKDLKAELVLDVNEFELLRKYVEAVPWKTSICREIVALIEWLDNIETVRER